MALDRDVDDVALIDLRDELGVANLIGPPALGGVLEEVEERKQQQANDDPDREIPEMRLHGSPFLVVRRCLLRAMTYGPLAQARHAMPGNIGSCMNFAKNTWCPGTHAESARSA